MQMSRRHTGTPGFPIVWGAGHGGTTTSPSFYSFFRKPRGFILSIFASLQDYSRQLYYQMNSFTGIFWHHFKTPMLPPCIDLSPPHQIWKSPLHVRNTCGKPCRKWSRIVLPYHAFFLQFSQQEGLDFERFTLTLPLNASFKMVLLHGPFDPNLHESVYVCV